MEAMQSQQTRPEAASPVPYAKRSFLKLPVEIDTAALLADYRAIPGDAWQVSHWETHCSSAMVLLRGGKKGTESDFTTREVSDKPLLSKLPYLRDLVGANGPFGQSTYAFIFRMKPMGVSKPHTDDNPAWKLPFRLHIPITTNDGAFLLSEGRAKHFRVGEVWSFDNQAMHAVVNGDTVRAHLIFDVPENPRLSALLERSEWDRGEDVPELWERAQSVQPQPTFAPLRTEPLTPGEKIHFGLNPEGFASRVTKVRWIGRVTMTPLEVGDIIHAVNGVEECVMARTASEYLQLRHQPGDTVVLAVIRGGKRIARRLTLYRNVLPTRVRRAIWQAMNAVGGAR